MIQAMAFKFEVLLVPAAFVCALPVAALAVALPVEARARVILVVVCILANYFNF